MDNRHEITSSVTYLIKLCELKNVNTDELKRVIEFVPWLDMNNLRIEYLRAVSAALNKLDKAEKNITN